MSISTSLGAGFDAAYRQMAGDDQREAEALEWGEATLGDTILHAAENETVCHEKAVAGGRA